MVRYDQWRHTPAWTDVLRAQALSEARRRASRERAYPWEFTMPAGVLWRVRAARRLP